MAISCLANDLVAGANCYCGIPPSNKWDVIISLLADIAGVSLDPKTLVANASCLCGIPDANKIDVMISLLCAISNSGGTAKVCILGGVGPPVVPVPCNFSAYVQQPGPNFGLWLGDLSTGWANVLAQGP